MLKNTIDKFYKDTLQGLITPSPTPMQDMATFFDMFIGGFVRGSRSKQLALTLMRAALSTGVDVRGNKLKSFESVYEIYMDAYFVGIVISDTEQLIRPEKLSFDKYINIIKDVTKEQSARAYTNTIYNWLKTGKVIDTSENTELLFN
jgi:hypothetical protein